MKSYTEDGVLVLADISGFTAFVTETELEHGPPIIAELLEAVMRRLSPPLEIQEVEGDAVFALGPGRVVEPPGRLLDVLDDAFVAFKTRQDELAADVSCACRACRSVSALDIKIVAHHGRFLRQTVGGHGQVAGVDVIVAHQLLKNRWARGRAYLLLTEAALRWLGVDPARAGLVAHTERYEHLGDVRCFVRDLERATVSAPSGDPAAWTPVAQTSDAVPVTARFHLTAGARSAGSTG
ncbi:MAG TPA: DUF2652 domain-containing protein [Methylomirabilota bacterium]|jgi:hypothetical protein